MCGSHGERGGTDYLFAHQDPRGVGNVGEPADVVRVEVREDDDGQIGRLDAMGRELFVNSLSRREVGFVERREDEPEMATAVGPEVSVPPVSTSTVPSGCVNR